MTLYAATNRLRQESPDDPASGFSDARATTFSAARFSISIPPTHKAGNIEWPGRHPDPLVAMTVAARQDTAGFDLVFEHHSTSFLSTTSATRADHRVLQKIAEDVDLNHPMARVNG